MMEKYLQDIGLSDKEAVVYLSLLSVENASVLDLAKKTKIKRPTVYVVLESLAKKGLVSETTVGKKQTIMQNHLKDWKLLLKREN